MPAVLTKNRHPMKNSYTPVRRPSPTIKRRTNGGTATAHTPKIDVRSLQKAALWLGGLSVVLLIFFGLSVGLMKLYRYCTTSDFFQVSKIQVQGARQLNSDDIIEQSGLHTGMNSLSVHIPELEKKLLQNPWVESVSIKRELPDQFSIHIQERVPQFWVLKEGALHYLDNHGLLIAPVESENFRSLPTLDIGPGGDEAIPYLADFMTQLETMNIPFDLSHISWLRISAGKGFELYWESKRLSLCIGIEHWRENLNRLSLVVADMEKRGEIDATREIRAADGQVWLQKS